MLHGPADVGRMKAVVAAEKLAAVAGSQVAFGVHAERVTAINAAAILADYQVIVDGTDNPRAKFLLNDAAVLLDKPLVHAGVVGLEGQLLTILPRRGACLRCLFPVPPADDEVASCSQAGILGPLAGMIGALEAREAVQILRGAGEGDRLLTIDARSLRLREIPVRRSPDCPLCSPAATIHALHDSEEGARAMNPASKETA
jgi:molybdopterin-synthase adenylyltransferase